MKHIQFSVCFCFCGAWGLHSGPRRCWMCTLPPSCTPAPVLRSLLCLKLHICLPFPASARIKFVFIFSACILGMFLLSRDVISNFSLLLNISDSRFSGWWAQSCQRVCVFCLLWIMPTGSTEQRRLFYIISWVCWNWPSQGSSCLLSLHHHREKFKSFRLFP